MLGSNYLAKNNNFYGKDKKFEDSCQCFIVLVKLVE